MHSNSIRIVNLSYPSNLVGIRFSLNHFCEDRTTLRVPIQCGGAITLMVEQDGILCSLQRKFNQLGKMVVVSAGGPKGVAIPRIHGDRLRENCS